MPLRTAALLTIVLAALAAAAAPAGAAIVKDKSCAVSGKGDSTIVKWTEDSFAVRPTGSVDTAMLFVDFDDATAGSLETTSLYDTFVPRSQRWFAEVSYGRASLNVRARHGWLRMPKPASAYFPPGGERDFDSYIADAIAAADPSFDFSGVEVVYIVPPPNSGSPNGPAHFGPAVMADGQRLRNHVTFGDDTMLTDPVSETHSELLVHETGHELGLPDYYRYEGDDIHGNVGSWDPMGEAFLGNHFSAWSKRKLGWLGRKEFVCMRSGSTTAELRSLDSPSGIRGAFIRLSATRAYIVESRRQRGFDAPICSEGVIVYLLDGNRDGDKGALRVRPRLPDSGDGSGCPDRETGGRFDRAAFPPGTTFKEGKVTVKVLSVTDAGHRVKITRKR